MAEFFLKILNMSISASWLVLAVLVLRLALKKAPKWVNVLLWGIVAVRLICPFTIESVLSLIPSAETISPEIMLDPMPTINTGVDSINRVVNPIITEFFAPSGFASANPLQIWIPVAACVWIIGMVIMVLYTAVSYWRVAGQVRTAVLVRDHIWESEFVPSPFILGVIHPRIYLPTDLEPKDLHHVVAHEKAHIRRKDHWWKPLGFLLLTVHWFNPLMWVAYILLCRDIELACDERVIREMGTDQRADYSEVLLACSAHRKRIAACPLAFGEVGVKERVRSVVNYRKPGFWVVLIAVIVCIAVAVFFLTDPVTEQEENWQLEQILYQDGYRITGQTLKKEISLTLEVDKLPAQIYSEDGYMFTENEYIVWQDDMSAIYLSYAKYDGTSEYVVLGFDFSYDLRPVGSLVAPYRVQLDFVDNHTKSIVFAADLKSENVIVDGTVLAQDGAYFRGQGPEEQFAVNIKTEVLRSATDNVTFTVENFYTISYAKNYDIISESGESYGQVQHDRSYVFMDPKGDLLSASNLQLYSDYTFSFSFSPISSYWGHGTYEIADGKVLLRTDDGKFYYTFRFSGEDLVFVEEESSEETWFSGLTDGSIMRYIAEE